jgi:hypothetical protein
LNLSFLFSPFWDVFGAGFGILAVGIFPFWQWRLGSSNKQQ